MFARERSQWLCSWATAQAHRYMYTWTWKPIVMCPTYLVTNRRGVHMTCAVHASGGEQSTAVRAAGCGLRDSILSGLLLDSGTTSTPRECVFPPRGGDAWTVSTTPVVADPAAGRSDMLSRRGRRRAGIAGVWFVFSAVRREWWSLGRSRVAAASTGKGRPAGPLSEPVRLGLDPPSRRRSARAEPSASVPAVRGGGFSTPRTRASGASRGPWRGRDWPRMGHTSAPGVSWPLSRSEPDQTKHPPHVRGWASILCTMFVLLTADTSRRQQNPRSCGRAQHSPPCSLIALVSVDLCDNRPEVVRTPIKTAIITQPHVSRNRESLLISPTLSLFFFSLAPAMQLSILLLASSSSSCNTTPPLHPSSPPILCTRHRVPVPTKPPAPTLGCSYPIVFPSSHHLCVRPRTVSTVIELPVAAFRLFGPPSGRSTRDPRLLPTPPTKVCSRVVRE